MKNWNYIEGAKTGNSKACNADVVKDGDVWVVLYAEGTKSKEFDSEAEAKRFAAQVGNKMVKYTSKADSKKEFLYDEETGDLEVWYDGKKVDSLKKAGEGWKKYIETHATKTGNAEPFDEFIKKLAKEKPELYQSLWNAGKMEALKSYYHKITGNDTPAEYFSKKPKVIGNDKTGVEGFFKQLSDDVKEREKKDDKEIEKVGNYVPNYRYKDFLITNPEGYEFIVFLKDGRTVGYRGTTSKAQAEDWCDWHDPKTGKSIGNKVGNSASDDKFAYVMREFDEGKLKTPDGKVVTDPAQAKAIAYSESKKTENGLARARNAMNKKVKNSAVREYKHSDGRIAQIDFNEDGSDADMSIYEGTKEIEQRNFSTIRDAEQYVTSHGFRRI